MPVVWERSGEAYYASVRGLVGEIIVHLVVEGEATHWDWVVWEPGDSELQAIRGVAVSVQKAMRDAEWAAVDRL